MPFNIPVVSFQLFCHIHKILKSEIAANTGKRGIKLIPDLLDFLLILFSLCDIQKQRFIPYPADAGMVKPVDNRFAIRPNKFQFDRQHAVHQITISGKTVMEGIAGHTQYLALAQAGT